VLVVGQFPIAALALIVPAMKSALPVYKLRKALCSLSALEPIQNFKYGEQFIGFA